MPSTSERAPSPGRLFQCVLDSQPEYLVPAHLWVDSTVPDPRQRLVVNPWCAFSWRDRQAGVELPTSHFHTAGDVVWVRDPVTGLASPFWIGEATRAALGTAAPGDPAPAAVGPNMRRILSAARVLVAPDDILRSRIQWADVVSRSASEFRDQDYVSVTDLIHPFHLGALRRYYRRLLRTGGMTPGDPQSKRRYVAHNEPVARFFHAQLTRVVSAIADAPLKPSYVYVAAYQSGGDLPRHTDREQCEYSITLLVDFSPEPSLESPWPLWLETPRSTVRVSQALGDALLYRGRRIAHFRRRLPDGMTSTSIFFHYVREDFSGSLT
jgi:hypothetical protein